jgi:hypothetical protein
MRSSSSSPEASGLRPSSSWRLATLYGVLIFALNAAIVWRLFGVEYTRHLQSNEGGYIAIARIISERPAELLWWPLWNAGMPFEHTYFPLLHFCTAFLAAISGWSPAHAYHAATALFYCLGAVTLFLLAWKVTDSPGRGLAAALLYSLVSPSCLLIPEVRADTSGDWNARRLYSQVYYGDAPHVASLALLPLALLFLYLYLKRRRPIAGVLAGASMGAVVLTNAFGAVALALGVLCLLSSGLAGPFRRDTLARFLLVSLCAYLVISPWLPPSVLQSIRENATREGDFPAGARLAALALFAAAFLLAWVLGRRLRAAHLRFFLLFAVSTAAVPVLVYAWDLWVLPQPRRYHLEMEMGICLLLAFAAPSLPARIPTRARIVIAGVLIVVGIRQAVLYRNFADSLTAPIDITRTIEYQTARFMEKNAGGGRVMASGSCSLWLNTFSDVPQLSGGHYTTSLNWIQQIAVFTIYTGMNAGPRDGEIAVLWLKAFGVRAINVPGPGAREHYKPFNNPKKFAGLLPEVWRDGEDVIYSVPGPPASLAHVVPSGSLARRPPIHGLDVDEVRVYVQALEDRGAPPARMKWQSFHSAEIDAVVPAGDAVSVQINYHPGWRATLDGVPQQVMADGLGLLAVRPACNGPCTLRLSYERGLEAKVTALLSAAAGLLALVWAGPGLLRRRRPPWAPRTGTDQVVQRPHIGHM